jgi:hypothetical protein
MAGTPWDQIVSHYFGVFVTPKVARQLVGDPAFRDLRTRARTSYPELYQACVDIFDLATSANGSESRKSTEGAADSSQAGTTSGETWTPAHAATHLRITEHAVRLAIRNGFITADKHDGRWHLDPESVRRYGNRHHN